jgi:hypothetical protein
MCKESLINSNSVHVGPRTGLPDKILKGDHRRIILAKLESNWPSSLREKKIKWHPPFLFLLTATMLVGGRDCRTQFWKRITNGPFHQSLVVSGQVVSEVNIFSSTDGRPTQSDDKVFGSGELKKTVHIISYPW